jgi:hypothetical protein
VHPDGKFALSLSPPLICWFGGSYGSVKFFPLGISPALTKCLAKPRVQKIFSQIERDSDYKKAPLLVLDFDFVWKTMEPKLLDISESFKIFINLFFCF